MTEHIILNKKLAAIDKKMERLYQQRDRLREERAQLCDEYIKTHQLVPAQSFAKAVWTRKGRKEGDQLKSGCGINLGYKCNGGKGFACDRFHWWNQERRVGMTHYEWMLHQAAQSQQETMDLQ